MVAFLRTEAGRGALKYRGRAARRRRAARTNFTRLNLGTVWVRWTMKKFKKVQTSPNSTLDGALAGVQSLCISADVELFNTESWYTMESSRDLFSETDWNEHQPMPPSSVLLGLV